MMNSDFAAGMRKLAASVTVITCRHEGVSYGLTASAVTALSAQPPSLIACVNQDAYAHGYIQKAGVFCVNILGTGDESISNIFSSEERDKRFSIGDWESTPNGAPRLTSAAASFECEVLDALPGFTHSVYVGLITDIKTSSANALLYADGSYGKFAGK